MGAYFKNVHKIAYNKAIIQEISQKRIIIWKDSCATSDPQSPFLNAVYEISELEQIFKTK